MLHHRQQMAEMLAMVAASPAKDRSLVGWSGQFGLRQHGRNRRSIFVLKLARIGGYAALDQARQQLVDLEQLRNEAPAPVEPFGHAPRALVSAVANRITQSAASSR